ncbi:UV DNA damage repair endonuclease UvsE [Nostoc sp. FACHB-152]|uniref:UV DNA damage repair endonuclease UvsE n=1 Tax=unclassified Nostoc TaxID=2593658 RepID=UPI0016883DDD|nr:MULTISPECIES: UV DNA damage repair endonuclease UvsE [unclassified Nostoc]MBD2447089.1 UV DNA damage repair endonuclease UvsE [Nostoc sp. FACHB-152]MBD2472484.1 UV DNA damage repair endonuclease UvsE [Nostoc sp. FACHB-145]
MTISPLPNLQNQERSLNTTVPNLGLVCITASQQVRFKTITRTRYLKLSLQERESTLRLLYQNNLQKLHDALSFCQANQIRLYRMPSGLFPMSDIEDKIGANILEQMSADLEKIGQRAEALGIRMVLHPDQFVVLSSDSPEVVQNSIKILADHARSLDLLGLPRSPWSLMNIHGGKSQRAEQLVKVILQLPPAIKNRLTLENDEYAYSSSEILAVCQQAGIPLVFDAHHHICHENLDSYDEPSVVSMFEAARTTWTNPDWQLVHISNGETAFKDRKHSDLITDMPSIYRQAPWIEVEAKRKEEAIAYLRDWWLMGQ